ncbi:MULTISPECIES: restriction endonuclease subunit S [Coprococcus]|jgi:type I restriction enzyme S subunit|uniref:restriction endonuclease subunit S n=1 Tax=Coprococcus TaxID=33042 RepID=UPI0015710674|nr:restriction endonuclease subunit S [Coprococcus eutactus]NSE71938.1 restriction endonuclease subunit S [Coprococcus eutactus]
MKLKLEDVCERGSSSLKQSDILGMTGDYPIYGASGYIGNVDFYHQEKPYVAIVKDGAGIGRTTFHTAKSSVIGTMQYLLPKDNVLPKYLYYVVGHMHLEKYFSGATIPHIYFKDYKSEEFNYDSLDKQKNIVEILGRCEKVISARKRELELLDSLIKARFVEMFGDVKYGSERWGGKPFKDITINLDSKRKPVKDADRKRMQGIYPYYGATGIVDYINDYRQDGDFLLISEDGKALELRSKPIAFLASGKIWVNNHAHVQQCTDECNMIYLMYHINFMDISIWVTGIDQKKLNRANLDTIPIALPPIELQEQFAAFVHQVDKSKVVVQKALDEAQLLFDSLMQKYFG